MATTMLNTNRPEMRASQWNRAIAGAFMRGVAVATSQPTGAAPNALLTRCVR